MEESSRFVQIMLLCCGYAGGKSPLVKLQDGWRSCLNTSSRLNTDQDTSMGMQTD